VSDTLTTGQSVRLDAWRSVFERTNRIISERPIAVRIVSDVPAGMEDVPGWSDGETVHYNGPVVLDMLRANDPVSAVLRLKGLNYHELSHVLYTPRLTDELPKRILDKAKESNDRTWWYAFNALEDQRIESMFSATYGPSRRYFEAAILEWLVKEGNAEAAILTYGRKYLPARIRVKAGRVFIKKHGADLYAEFQKVIDAYLGVRLPTETVKALKLVQQYHALIQRMMAAQQARLPNLPVRDNGCGGQGLPQKGDEGVVRKGRLVAKAAQEATDRAQKQAAQAAQADAEAEAELDQEGAGGGEGDMPDPDASSGDGSGQGDQSGDQGTGSGSGQGQGNQGNDTGDGGSQGGDAQGDGGQGAGSTGSVQHDAKAQSEKADEKSLEQQMRDLLDEASEGLEDMHYDDDILDDVDNVLDAVKAILQDGKGDAEGRRVNRQVSRDADESDNRAVRKVVQTLMRIRQDMEPAIVRRVLSGRVDPRRVLARRPNEVDVFTRYDEGAEDATGIEAVVLVDVSGSMSSRADEASTAMWAIKRAMDKLEIRCTVLVFDTDHQVLFQPGDKAPAGGIPVVNTGGGTDPTSALQQAHKILLKSNAPNKVLISVTDGQWSGRSEVAKTVLRAVHEMGGVSLLLGLDEAVERYGTHYHQHHHDLQSVRDLPKAVLKLVAAIMRSASRI
jgi:predicted metal-dependent peptidase